MTPMGNVVQCHECFSTTSFESYYFCIKSMQIIKASAPKSAEMQYNNYGTRAPCVYYNI